MMEDPPIRTVSPSCDSDVSVERNEVAIMGSLDDRLMDVAAKMSLASLRTPPTKKAKRVRFFRNGDKFYTGVVMAVTPERYRSFDSLASDLTRALISSVTLPNGVRAIYTMDGRKVLTVGDLEDGKCYVVSGQGESFKKVEYSASKVRRGSSLSGLPQSPAGTGRQISAVPSCVKAKIVTLIRNGSKPRRVMRLLLNKRNAPSLEHVFEAITEAVKLDSGAVRRVYTMTGKPVIALEQFFESEEVFVAYGVEKSTQEDFELDSEESKNVQSFRRGPWVSKRQGGPMPVMPRKSGKRTLTAPQVRTPSPSSLILPQPLRLHYAVGHVIGDGNFAVVRHCIHKTTGAEYAMKIVDKYKCQGKETMLASEVAILRQVCHPNIISLIGEQETVDQLFLVMELVKGGDLFDAIAAATKFSEAEASVMIGHLTSALAYLHSHHIVHRDVKPENLLVEMEGSQVRCLKLGDFGLAQVVREPLYTVCGTPTYVAPEILAESGYGLKIDVWAAGVILYILLCGFPPFVSPENDQEELFERILSGQYEFTAPYWEPVSDSAKQLISNMLQAQPELRFSAEDVLDHPWLVSFLGGDASVPGSRAAGKSSKQHRDQQCQPLRLATFEFDYKKQRRHDVAVSCDQTSTAVVVGDSNAVGSIGADVKSWFDASVNEAYRKSIAPNTQPSSSSEVDNPSGIRQVEDEPLSLSADCLQDIRDLTTSLQDLMKNIDVKIDKTSTSSIPEKYESSRLRNGENSPEPNRFGESPLSSRKKHSVNTRNGNSLTDIHSISLRSQRPENQSKPNSRQAETPRTANIAIDRILRPKKRNLSKASGFSRNGSSERHPSVDRLSQSTDGLSGSSDNNIETSDSFVNIQFAKQSRRGNESSSTQSIESSDSFENTHFVWDRGSRDRLEELKPGDSQIEVLYLNTPVSSDKRKSIALPRGQIKPPMDHNGSKNPRPSMIPVHSNGGQPRLSVKSTETSKLAQNEQTVKLREKKNLATSNMQAKGNESKSKRFSYFSQYSSRLAEANSDAVGKVGRASMGNGRKCSSTDELREEQQKSITPRTKRFSLYYTPQPSRKTYEQDIKSSKNASKMPANLGSASGGRPTSWKTPETARRVSEEAANDRRDLTRHRRSVAECSTAASRNKANRQAVHIRGNAASTNSNLAPGRTK